MSTRLLASFLPPSVHVVGQDLAVGHAAALDDVEDLLVGREAQAVGAEHAFGDDGRLAACRGRGDRRWRRSRARPCSPRSRRGCRRSGSVNQIEPSDFTTTSLGELSRLPSKLSASTVIEPSYSVRVDAAAAVLAGDEPALAVAGVAVGEVRGLAEDADRARLLLPLEDAVVGDVAPQQIAPVAEIDRPLGPAAAGGEALHAGELQPVLLEARIERDDGRDRDRPRGPASRLNEMMRHRTFAVLVVAFPRGPVLHCDRQKRRSNPLPI